MAARFVRAIAQPGGNFGISFQGDGGGEEGDRHFLPVEQALQPPDAGPRAVFVDGFHRQVAIGRIHRVGELAERGFVAAVGRHMHFRAFLAIDHQVDRNAGLVRPHDLWDAPAIADEVSRRARYRILRNFHDILPSCSSVLIVKFK